MSKSYAIILESYIIDDIATENVISDVGSQILEVAKALYRRVKAFFHNLWRSARRWWQKRKRQISDTKQDVEETKSALSKVEPGESNSDNIKEEGSASKMQYNIAEFERYQEQLLEQVINIIMAADGFAAHLQQVLISSKSVFKDLEDGKLGADIDSIERSLSSIEPQYQQILEYGHTAHTIHDTYMALEWNNPLMTEDGGEMLMKSAGKLEHNIQELLHFNIERLQQISTNDPQIKIKLINIVNILQRYSQYAMQIAAQLMKIALY